VDVSFVYPHPPDGYVVTMVVSMVPGASSSGWVANDTSCWGSSIYDPEPTPCFLSG
jgi:hypothetical protein